MLLKERDARIWVGAFEGLGHRLEVAVREEDRAQAVELCEVGLQRVARPF